MPIQKPDYQLMLDLDLPEEETEEVTRLSADEIRLRSETAKQALDGQTNLIDLGMMQCHFFAR